MTTEQFIQEMSEVAGIDFRAQVPEGTVLGSQTIDNTPGASLVNKKQSSLMRVGATALPDRVKMYDLRRHDVSNVPPTIANARMSRYPGRFTLREPANWHDSDPKVIDETCEVCVRDPERPEGAERPKFTSFDQLQEHYEFFHEFTWRRMERDRLEAERREDKGTLQALIGTLIKVMRPDADLPDAVREQIERLQENVPVNDENPVRRTRRARRSSE